MTVWAHEASRRWSSAWIGGAGPFACAVSYRKVTSITLFRTLREAEAHKRRLDAIQPEKALCAEAEPGPREGRSIPLETLVYGLCQMPPVWRRDDDGIRWQR